MLQRQTGSTLRSGPMLFLRPGLSATSARPGRSPPPRRQPERNFSNKTPPTEQRLRGPCSGWRDEDGLPQTLKVKVGYFTFADHLQLFFCSSGPAAIPNLTGTKHDDVMKKKKEKKKKPGGATVT